MTTLKFICSDGGRGQSHPHEQRDCTVRALALAADIPYTKAHMLLKKAGRRDGHRFPFAAWIWGRDNVAHHKITSVLVPEPRTINRALKKARIGRYIIRTKHHVFAVIDGAVYDTELEGKQCRVINMWKFKPI